MKVRHNTRNWKGSSSSSSSSISRSSVSRLSGIMNSIPTTITIAEASKVCSSMGNQSSVPSRIELTPWDVQFLLLNHIQKGILFYKPAPAPASSDSDEGYVFQKTVIHRLRTSLSRTLDFFPPLAGRLCVVDMDCDGEKVGFFIDCNDAGVEFIHAVVPGVSVSDILEPTYTPAVVSSFFPLTGVSNCDVSKPLFGVQVTELVDGFFIGCSANHAVIDGTSFWHFINSWSQISRGFDAISKPPVFERWFAASAVATNRLIPVSPPAKMMNHLFSPNATPLLERVFHFSKEIVSNLKAKANSEAGTDKISSLQSVLSHIWRSAARIRRQKRAPNTPEKKEISLLLVIGTRGRMLLPDGYFGNAAYCTLATANENDLSENGLGWAAMNLNKLVAQQTVETATKLVQDWTTDPMIFGNVASLATTKLDFGTSSSTRYDIYGNDFGWGKPLAVRSGKGQKIDGKLTVFPGPETGSIDVEACLAKETMHGLEDDVEFMGAFRILN